LCGVLGTAAAGAWIAAGMHEVMKPDNEEELRVKFHKNPQG
jgi:hypothetical protein